jgi:hypothetical protein
MEIKNGWYGIASQGLCCVSKSIEGDFGGCI